MRVACIGSRDLDAYQTSMCEKLGGYIVQHGHTLHSGNAPGADQAFARGANRIHPGLVHLHLPWPNFERQAVHKGNIIRVLEDHDAAHLKLYSQIAERHHPAFSRLSQGAVKLMTRNSSIMLPAPDYMPVDRCLAIPSDRRGGGGTGQGMRIAIYERIPLVDLRGHVEADLFWLCEEIAQWK